MKIINRNIYIAIVLYLCCFGSAFAINDFKIIHGSTDNEKPTRLIHENGFVYLIGQKETLGVEYAFFSKVDGVTGAVLCEVILDEESKFNDFTFNPNTQEFIVVGNLSFKQSIIYRFDLNCNVLAEKIYDQTGREEFTRVIFHQYAPDPAFPIYVLGRKNPSATPSNFDIPVVYNYDDALGMHWAVEYPEIGGNELELYRGMTGLVDGSVVFVGNGTISNEGALISIDGSNGVFNSGHYYLDAWDIYDIIQIPSTEDIVLAGTDFGNGQGLMALVDKNFISLSVVKFPDVKTFYDIGIDVNNYLYTTAKMVGGSNHPLVYRTAYQVSGSNRSLVPTWVQSFEDGDLSYEDPHLYVDKNDDHIYFTDARNHPVLSFGLNDVLLAKTELDFACACIEEVPLNWTSYVVDQITFDCLPNNLSEPILEPVPDASPFNDASSDYCNYPICSFDVNVNCFDVSLINTTIGGTAPFVVEWDIDCNNTFDYTGNTASHTYPPLPNSSVKCVRMKITDALGLMCVVDEFFVVEDIIPPSIFCPGNMSFNTDPGLCTKLYNVNLFGFDLCDPSVDINISFTGATVGGNGTNVFNVGLTNVAVVAIDNSGNATYCNFTITVIDNQIPNIICPPDVTIQTTLCDPWTTHYPPTPPVIENCPFTFVQFPNPLSIPCGTVETFTYIVEDASGNRDTCSYTLTVECPCGEIVSESFACNPIDDDVLDFTIIVDNGIGISGSANCTPSISTALSNVVLFNVNYSWSGSQLSITGSADVSCTFVNSVPFDISLNCVCSSGEAYSCDLQADIPTICCKQVYLQPDLLCKTGGNYSLPLFGCTDFCDVSRVNWYVSNGPCTPASWGPAFLSTSDCRDLLLDPTQFGSTVCVYAEVILGADDGPCNSVTSNVISLDLCDPVNFSLNGDQRFCYDNLLVFPGLIQANVFPSPASCNYSVQWYDANGLIPGANQLSYQPPGLSITGNPCSQTFSYTCKISNICGTTSKTVDIKLDNANAPDGSLVLSPNKALPLCNGDDATLVYTPQCVDPFSWKWWESNDGITYSQVPFSGNTNPNFNTNRLVQDKWYRIEKKNGLCPIDEIDFYLPVKSKLQINLFSASPVPVCNPLQVDLYVEFSPDQLPSSTCIYTVEWYKDGSIISSQNTSTSPVSYTYTNPGQLDGNYYVIIRNSCCAEVVRSQVITIDPAPELSIQGPCFRCNEEIVQLTSAFINAPVGYVCNYQWYDNGILIPGATGPNLTVQPLMTGPFMLKVTCTDGTNICTSMDVFDLKQCGMVCPPIINLSGTIQSGVFHAANVVNITGHIPAGANVIIRAGVSINIIQPFSVDPSATFMAQIQNCPY